MKLSRCRVTKLAPGARIVLSDGQIAEIKHITNTKGVSRQVTTDSGTVTLLRTATVQIAAG